MLTHGCCWGCQGGYLWVVKLTRDIWVQILHEEGGGVLYHLLIVTILS